MTAQRGRVVVKDDLRELLSPAQRELLERTIAGLGLGGKLVQGRSLVGGVPSGGRDNLGGVSDEEVR